MNWHCDCKQDDWEIDLAPGSRRKLQLCKFVTLGGGGVIGKAVLHLKLLCFLACEKPAIPCLCFLQTSHLLDFHLTSSQCPVLASCQCQHRLPCRRHTSLGPVQPHRLSHKARQHQPRHQRSTPSHTSRQWLTRHRAVRSFRTRPHLFQCRQHSHHRAALVSRWTASTACHPVCRTCPSHLLCR